MSETVRIELTTTEVETIKESLKYAKQEKENYAGHPSPEFKKQQVAAIDTLLKKLSSLPPV